MFLCCVHFPATPIPFWWRYIISFIATAANPGSFAYFLVHLCFAYFPVLLLFRPGSFCSLSCSSWVISVATLHRVVSPNNRFYKNVSKCYYVCHWCRHLILFKSPFRRKRIITCKHKCSIMFNIPETSSQEYCMFFADRFHCIAPRNKILNRCVVREFITKHEIKIILKSGWIDSGNIRGPEL